jgi:acyl-CoA synthetase (AMP-forming)/AMP-acid ligase II
MAMRITLYQWSGVTELPVISPMANRHAFSILNDVIGCFANEIPLFLPLDPAAGIKTYLAKARADLFEILDNQGFSFSRLLERLRLQRRPDSLPLAQLFFSYLDIDASLPFRRRFEPVTCLGYDLSFTVVKVSGAMKVLIGYDTALSKDATALSLGNLFTEACDSILRYPAAPPQRLPSAGLDDALPKERKLSGFGALLDLSPDEQLCFIRDEDAPPLKRCRQAAVADGIPYLVLPEDSICQAEQRLVLVSAQTRLIGAIGSLAESSAQASANRSPQRPVRVVRLCLLNFLPSASGLRELAAKVPEGRLLLELPVAGTDVAPGYAVVMLKDCRAIEDRERFIDCRTCPSQVGHGREPFAARRIALPRTGCRHQWHAGQAIDLDGLAAEWRRYASSPPLALSITPADDGKDRLIAWVVPEKPFDAAAFSAWLNVRVPGLGVFWNDCVTEVSSLPLTTDGNLDRHTLELLPVILSSRLRDYEKALGRETGLTLRMTLEKRSGQPELAHCSELLPDADSIFIQPRYSILKTAAPADVDPSRSNLSILRANPLRGKLDISFSGHMQRLDNKRIVFISSDGRVESTTGKIFFRRAAGLLQGMQRCGLKSGNAVILYCSREAELLCLAWACLLGCIRMTALLPPAEGQTPAPIHTRLAHMRSMLGAPPVIASSLSAVPEDQSGVWLLNEIAELGGDGSKATFHEPQNETVIYTAFTSGSTGVPKAVPLTALNVFSSIYAKMEAVGPIESETALSMTALDHVASLFCHSFYATVRGAEQVYCPFQYVLADPLRVLDLIHGYRVSHTWAPDFTWRHIHEALKSASPDRGPWDLSCLHHIISGGENTREATFSELERGLAVHGLPNRVFLHSWGMSETSSFFTLSDFWDGRSHVSHLGIIDTGGPLPGGALRVADPQGNTLPEGCVGSFQVSGPMIFKGYLKNPEANAESFTKDGWFITGDLAVIKDGKIVVCGREKEQVVVRGQNISQFDIEGFLDGIDGVEPTFSVVLGCMNAHSREDEVIVLVHTLVHETAARRKLTRRIHAALAANYGITPQYVLMVGRDDIPKAALGKIQRTTILKKFIQGGFAEQMKEYDLLMQTAASLPDWTLRKQWRRHALPEGPLSLSHRLFALFGAAAAGLELRLIKERLEKAGARAIVASLPSTEGCPFGSDDALAFFEQGDELWFEALYVLKAEPEYSAQEAFHEWEREMFCDFCRWVAGLSRLDIGITRCLVVTIGGQNVAPDDSAHLWTAAAGGLTATLGRTVAWPVRLVDFEDGALQQDCGDLIRELAWGDDEPFAAWRQGLRYIPCFDRPSDFQTGPERDVAGVLTSEAIFQPAEAYDWEAPFRNDRFCLCTGMTGAVGRRLLPLLLGRTDGNYLLIGRKRPSEAMALLGLCAGATSEERLLYVQADLDDVSSIKAAVAKALERFSRRSAASVRLGGVFHLAANTAEQDFSTCTPEAICASLHERQRHLEVLTRVTAEIEVESCAPCVLFSSPVAFWGGASSAVYAPACALAEAFVQNRRGSAHAPEWRCFIWSRWQGENSGEDAISELLKRRGFLPVNPEHGLLSMLYMLKLSYNDRRPLLAGFECHNPSVSRFMRLPGDAMPVKEATVVLPTGCSQSDVLSHWKEHFTGFGASLRFLVAAAEDGAEQTGHPASLSEKDGERRMADLWSSVLRLSFVDPNGNFFEMGGTSVHVPQLRSAVQKNFGVDIGSVGVFHYPSVREMTQAVAGTSERRKTAPDAALSRAQKQRRARHARR